MFEELDSHLEKVVLKKDLKDGKILVGLFHQMIMFFSVN